MAASATFSICHGTPVTVALAYGILYLQVIVDETPASPTIRLQKVRGGLLRLIGALTYSMQELQYLSYRIVYRTRVINDGGRDVGVRCFRVTSFAK